MHKDELGLVWLDATVHRLRLLHHGLPLPRTAYRRTPETRSKCDGCRDRLVDGGQPVCVEACPLRALEFG
ncbi:MAG: 4Fe-4S dicluster domain-containing protein [Eggerthella lenta]